MPARVAAASIVQRVLDEGAYSNVALTSLPGELSEADASHARRLVMETVRNVRTADAVLGAAASRPLGDLDAAVRSVLRVAVVELIGGAAAHAVIDCAVEASREMGQPRAAGFVNGVLRTSVRRALPETSARSAAEPWIVDRLDRTYGRDQTTIFLEAAARAPRLGVRLRADDVESEPTGIDGAGYVPPAALADLIRRGAVVVVDPSSVAASLAVRAQPGMTVADVACAPGGKTSHLWDQMAGEGRLVALDRHRRRLSSAMVRLDRLDMHPLWLIGDATAPALRHGSFDRVLLDAPCTGLGTLRRRPEIMHRLEPDSPGRLAVRQRAMLDASLSLVKPGGFVVYSVCTLFSEETIDVVASYDARPPSGLPGVRLGKGLLLAPHITGTDGMFIAEVRRPG